jgi:type IV secretory pathway TraG/TraD family ATPase VirD4
MALELSPWLFSALHQDSFVDMEQWVKDRSWVIMRLPTGQVGRESARLIASVVYNVFDAAFRKATFKDPIPFYFVIDEAQEIGTGMRLESMLAEGAKFGARMFVLTQSLQMMRKTENMEALVQSLLANTSTQAFFSPDTEQFSSLRRYYLGPAYASVLAPCSYQGTLAAAHIGTYLSRWVK